MAVIVVLAGLKVLSSTGLVDASTREKVELRPDSRAMLSMPSADKVSPDGIKKKGGESEETSEPVMNAVQVPSMNVANGSLTEAEKRVLLSLDDRRVELERRKASLDKKEAEIKKQTRVLAERMAELRSLTARLAEVREEKDRKYDVRMEQLAGVYGSMAPNEAAPLIAKLDEKIALALLQRMTGKRMGQILSVMDPEQAVALTKSLTDRQKL
jgi:flagellar motility protein MotE (MotC chaperone)